MSEKRNKKMKYYRYGVIMRRCYLQLDVAHQLWF